ncbi:hypothetical protein HX035_24380 [Escherichia coli]|nr:hypothetical protein [Escherichia coli]
MANGLPTVGALRHDQIRRLIKKVAPYQLIAGELYKLGKDGILRKCVPECNYVNTLELAHSGPSGGHFAAEITAKKVLMSGLWWPTLFADAAEFTKRCDECQRTAIPQRKDRMPLKPVLSQ